MMESEFVDTHPIPVDPRYDDALAEVQEHLTAVTLNSEHHRKYDRNSLLPMISIPAELLGEIFIFNLFAGGVSGFSYPGKVGSPTCWTNVTHVCRRWRDVALSTPRLWSFVGTNSAGWLGAFVSRSKTTPLHIRFINPRPAILFSVPCCGADSGFWNRIQELHIQSNHIFSDYIFDRFDSLPSLITSLRLGIPAGSSRARLPKELPSRSFHLLTQLELQGCVIDLESPIFTSSNLTHLTLINHRDQEPPPYTRLITVLQSQKRLVHLDLSFMYATHEPVTADIHLPCIRKLALSGRSSFALAANIRSLHNRTKVRLVHSCAGRPWLPISPNQPSELDSIILPFLSSYYGSAACVTSSTTPTSTAPVIRYLSLRSERTEYNIRCSYDQEPTGTTTCRLKLTWLSSKHADPIFTAGICSQLPLARVRILRLKEVKLDIPGWIEVFTRMEELEDLCVTGDSLGLSIVQALEPSQGMGVGDQERSREVMEGYIQAVERSRQSEEESRQSEENYKQSEENYRQAEEKYRQVEESSRKAEESSRQADEGFYAGISRQYVESCRQYVESCRKFAENDRRFLENDRRFAENDRRHAEDCRQYVENCRQYADLERSRQAVATTTLLVDAGAPREVPCPRLRRLEFLLPNLERWRLCELQTCLAERKAQNCRLSTLALMECRNFSAEDMESLITANVVDRVEWDGHVQMDT